MREIVECEPACSWVTHVVPGYGAIHHALTCSNHPRMLRRHPLPPNVPIPIESTMPSTVQIAQRRNLVECWWLEGYPPRWIAEQLTCSVPTINEDIRYLRVHGRIGRRRDLPNGGV